MEDGFYGKNRHTLNKQKWRRNSWTTLGGPGKTEAIWCCCAQCSQSSAFLWLLYHLITAVECLLSATCLFLVHFESTAVFWFSSHYSASSFLFCFTGFLGLLNTTLKVFPPLMTITNWGHAPDIFRWDYYEQLPNSSSGFLAWQTFSTYHFCLCKKVWGTSDSSLNCLHTAPIKDLFCNWNITHIS